MGWWETLNTPWREALGYDRTKGPRDWIDHFQKFNDASRLRQSFAFFTVTYSLIAAAGVIFAAYTTGFSYLAILYAPVLAPVFISLWCIWHAYARRRRELAMGGRVTRPYDLSRLRWRFAPLFGGVLPLIVVLCVITIWGILRCDSWEPFWLLAILAVIGFCIQLWYYSRYYNRLKRELVDGERDKNKE